MFNDPPTETRFSDMASTVPNRQKFVKSLIQYMQKYSLDGVDLGESSVSLSTSGSSH